MRHLIRQLCSVHCSPVLPGFALMLGCSGSMTNLEALLFFFFKMLNSISAEKILWTGNCIFFSWLCYFRKVAVVICKMRLVRRTKYIIPWSADPTKWSNTTKQFVGSCRQIVWVCLTILWGSRLKGYWIISRICLYYLYCRF